MYVLYVCNACMYAIYVCMYVMYACMYVCTYVCMYVCNVCMYVQTVADMQVVLSFSATPVALAGFSREPLQISPRVVGCLPKVEDVS